MAWPDVSPQVDREEKNTVPVAWQRHYSEPRFHRKREATVGTTTAWGRCKADPYQLVSTSWPGSCGGLMILGLAAIPGFFGEIDSWEASPWDLKYVGMSASSLGWLVLYPLWCLWLGLTLLLS